MAGRPLIIDCDPGQDDAIALLLAFASPEAFDLLGICALAGNVPVELTAMNARRVRELAGRLDVPIYAGCPRPILHPLRTAEHVHGKSGIDGAELPEPTMPLEQTHALDFITETLRTAKEKVTIATLGPLTDIPTNLRPSGVSPSPSRYAPLSSTLSKVTCAYNWILVCIPSSDSKMPYNPPKKSTSVFQPSLPRTSPNLTSSFSPDKIASDCEDPKSLKNNS